VLLLHSDFHITVLVTWSTQGQNTSTKLAGAVVLKIILVKPSSGFSLQALGPYLFAKAEFSLQGTSTPNEDSATEGPHITHMGFKAMKELVYRAEVS
jgi:hypothetical protein